MDCPRCGTRLTRLSLNGERQSVYCERCRFADVESDHTSVSAGEETWDDALRRFRSAHAADGSAGNGDAETESDDDAAKPDHDGETSADDDGGADATAEDSGSESDHPADDTEEA